MTGRPSRPAMKKMTVTGRRVREALIELTDTLVTDFDIIDFLRRLAVRCTGLLGRLSLRGVPLADLNLVAASTEQARSAAGIISGRVDLDSPPPRSRTPAASRREPRAGRLPCPHAPAAAGRRTVPTRDVGP
jgi:hypothetical protein